MVKYKKIVIGICFLISILSIFMEVVKRTDMFSYSIFASVEGVATFFLFFAKLSEKPLESHRAVFIILQILLQPSSAFPGLADDMGILSRTCRIPHMQKLSLPCCRSGLSPSQPDCSVPDILQKEMRLEC